MPAFTDSVDLSNNYEIGACGEKIVTFDPATPAFITLQVDATDPILNALKISYAEAQATTSDVEMSHIIRYTVISKEYDSHINSLSDSFTVKIVCPDNVLYSESSEPNVSFMFDIPAR